MEQDEKIELLSPAGDLDRLRLAVDYGADAVYLGGQVYGMRAGSKNFSLEEMAQGVAYAHRQGRRVYLTCNTMPRNSELKNFPDYLRDIAACGIDALIVADLGVLELVKKTVPAMEIHISTQAGIVNFAAAQAYYNLGASRVVLARELSLEEIGEIRGKISPALELEAFVHGAMCMSVSGRCTLSDYLVGRDANRGDCAQPCRWKYHLMEETRPGHFFPVIEDGQGAYILNAKDLCMIEHIPELAQCGIHSFKIEGRAKSGYYTAMTTHAYRAALDGYQANPTPDYRPEPWIVDEVHKISHREYSTGFYFGPIHQGQVPGCGGYIRTWDVAAMADRWEDRTLTVTQRNRFYEGDTLEVVQPGKPPFSLLVCGLKNHLGESTAVANQADQTYSFLCEAPVDSRAFLRRKRGAGE